MLSGERREKMKKKKAVIASLVLGLSMSAGTAFAISDAGERLKFWYDSKFHQSQNDMNENIVKPLLEDMRNQLENHANELIDESKQRIEELAHGVIGYSIGSIYIHTGEYIKQIRDKEAELKPKVSSDFDSFVREKNEAVDSFIDSEAEKFLNALNNELDGIVTDTSKNIQDTSNKAQEDLKDEIAITKSQVSEQIKLNQERSEEEIKDNIDTNTIQAKENIESFAQIYSNEKIKAIEEKAKELEEQAQESMSNIILNIKI
jgi:hypothetical protein